MQKKIKDLLDDIKILKFYPEDYHKLLEKNVNSIKYNSKEIKPYDIFVCLPGQHTEGILYIDEAIKNGAVCIVADKEVKYVNNDVLYILVEDTRVALAKLSSNFYENPSKKMLLVGITGTNGKTTITYLLESIFREAGYNPAVIGTINYRFNDKIYESKNTTPFASDLQRLLYEMYVSAVEVVIMEVSSHALYQARVLGCEFDVAVFTNLSSEHLDYHKNMDEYFLAKSILFKNLNKDKKEIFKGNNLGRKVCVINYDDEYGKKLVDMLKDKEVLLYGKVNNTKNKFKAVNITYFNDKTQFEIKKNGEKVFIESKLIGEFNVYNILASYVVAYSQSIEDSKIVDGIKKVTNIKGRLERISTPQGYDVIIDYAHTPDALQKVILTLKRLPHRKLIVVFGCGGDRDRSKRPIMGFIATALSDYVIVTSDNPRSEDPQKIILDIEVGIKKSKNTNYEIIVDRKEAIFRALSIAQQGDIVLLAGKGHEDYQILADEKIHFDEREIINDFFRIKK